ncbi:MAG TPA: hypothetical protein VGQ42_01525 [Candidatus Dormibacteraeota bacterium]|jgi:hypothetical protein|nr:hypothetical protein [Candidatus Dormibacteraeota bacterium]
MTAGKLCLALALFLVGFGAMLVTRRLPWYAQCGAGLLAVLNPWVFDRLSEGQWGVVGAAGALFIWVAAFDALQRKPDVRRAAALALAGVVTVALSANFAGILGVLAIAAVIAGRPWRDRTRLRWTATAAALTCVLLLYGVVPFFLQQGGGTYATVQSYGRADFLAFRPTPDQQYGAIPALAGLYGEWAERSGRIPVATTGNPWWPASTALLVAFAVIGAIRAPQRRWLLPAGLVGLAISASTATSWGIDAAVWLAQHVPLAAAYRDTQKWDALWLVALAILGAEAVTAVPRLFRGRRPLALWAGPAAATVMALAILFPAGIHQLQTLPDLVKPADYPQDWYAAAAYLDGNVPRDAPVVVLPWHLYEPLDFTGRLVANPAPEFFPGTLIVPNDPELPGQTAPAASPGNIGAIALAQPEPRPCALADAVRAAGVRWVVLEHTTGDEEALRRLRPCGFHIVEGAPGRTAVLSG